jgi:hypothetical protein
MPGLAGLPPVTDGRVGALLGVPLVVFDGSPVGALIVYSRQPRPWTDGETTLLRQLADSVATELELATLSREFEAHRLPFELAIDAAEIGSFDWDLVTGRSWRSGCTRRTGRGRPRRGRNRSRTSSTRGSGQPRGSSAQTCLNPLVTYQPWAVAISAMRYSPSPPSLGSRSTAGDGGAVAASSETSIR